MRKTKEQLERELSKTINERNAFIMLTVTVAIIGLIVISLAQVHLNDLRECEKEILEYKDITFQMCNNFNSMAEVAKKLIVNHINSSFVYEGVADCRSLK